MQQPMTASDAEQGELSK